MCLCFLWYLDRIDKGQTEIKRIEVWDENRTWYYVQKDNGQLEEDTSIEVNPRPHITYTKTGDDALYYEGNGGYGFIPFFRLDNSRKQVSGLKPVKDLMVSVNKRQIEVRKIHVAEEKEVLRQLKKIYEQAVNDCETRICELSMRTDMENLQSVIWQRRYQEALKKRLDSVLNSLNTKSFTTIADYLTVC